jgi:transposase
MGTPAGFEVHAQARVERGTAQGCACGGHLEWDGALWVCTDCGKEYDA